MAQSIDRRENASTGLYRSDALEKVPLRHRDSFDRLLIAQAVAGQWALVSSDQAITNYPEAACVWD